jgi:predicted RNA-binding protein YlqC (UPF0109 family)
MPEFQSQEMCALISTLIRAMVDGPDAVAIECRTTQKGTLIAVKVAQMDLGKVIGLQGRNARALRQILSTISKAQKQTFILDIQGQ